MKDNNEEFKLMKNINKHRYSGNMKNPAKKTEIKIYRRPLCMRVAVKLDGWFDSFDLEKIADELNKYMFDYARKREYKRKIK